jgi:hypothetical protein
MALATAHNRYLIIIHGSSVIKMVSIERNFGGSLPRASVTRSQLRDAIIGVFRGMRHRDYSFKIVNGFAEGYATADLPFV